MARRKQAVTQINGRLAAYVRGSAAMMKWDCRRLQYNKQLADQNSTKKTSGALKINDQLH